MRAKFKINQARVNRDLNSAKMHLWTKFRNPNLNRWCVMGWTSSKRGQFQVWSQIWPWRSQLTAPKNNRDLNQGVLLLWTKFGDPSLNRWRVIVRTSKWLIHTHTQTQAMTIPGGQNWPRVKKKPHWCSPINSQELQSSATITRATITRMPV